MLCLKPTNIRFKIVPNDEIIGYVLNPSQWCCMGDPLKVHENTYRYSRLRIQTHMTRMQYLLYPSNLQYCNKSHLFRFPSCKRHCWTLQSWKVTKLKKEINHYWKYEIIFLPFSCHGKTVKIKATPENKTMKEIRIKINKCKKTSSEGRPT